MIVVVTGIVMTMTVNTVNVWSIVSTTQTPNWVTIST